jgi:hypothetical protein
MTVGVVLQPHGMGVFKGKQGFLQRYDGEWAMGHKQGRGVAVFDNGDKYEGEFRENTFFGLGKYIFANGTILEGRWVKNTREGRCTVTAPDKTVSNFEGDYVDSIGALFLVPSPIPTFEDARLGVYNKYLQRRAMARKIDEMAPK